MDYNYSEDYKKIIFNKELVKTFLVGSHVAGYDFDLWVKRRSFIAELINKSGTIIDVGCANGFFLRSLQEWSKYKLIPYGIDIDLKFIEQIKELFPNDFKNFIKLDVHNINDLQKYSLPDKYDFIYWNIWDNWNLDIDEQQEVVAEVKDHVNPDGRLILGFYDNREKNMERIDNLENVGFRFNGLLINKYGEEIAAWMDL
ncbi:MAG: class I SAM-dependent methyltransferase [Candidatus Micrarchaeia archaeon]